MTLRLIGWLVLSIKYNIPDLGRPSGFLECVVLLGVSTVVTPQLSTGSGLTLVLVYLHLQVNGLPVALPVDVLTSVSVSQTSDGSILVQQKAGVSVWLGTDGQLTVAVSDDHAGALCGACGNFDRNPTNDLGDSQEDTDMDKWRAPDFSPW